MIAAFFGMLIISVWYGTRIDALTISTVTVKGGETIQHAEVERIVRSKLEGTYVRLVPKTFAFTYPHDAILKEVHAIHRVKNVQVTRVGGNELLVEFDEYVPHALWCNHSESSGCYFLDENGYSFAPAPTLLGGAFLRFVSIGKDPAEHTQAFEQYEYTRVHELVRALAEAKWFVDKAEVDAAGDAFLTIVDGGLFKVSLKQSPQETVANLLTVLGSDKFAHIKPGNFEYIDLRFGEKVFVNEVTIDNTASTTDVAAQQPDTETVTATQHDTTVSGGGEAFQQDVAAMVAEALASTTED